MTRPGLISAGPCRECGEPTDYVMGSAGRTVARGLQQENQPIYLHHPPGNRGHQARPVHFDPRNIKPAIRRGGGSVATASRI